MRLRAIAAVGAALLALAGCGKPPVEAKPALWRVSEGDTTIWLLGSIHLLPPDVAWRTPAIERAIDEADQLVIESSPEDRINFRVAATGTNLLPVSARVTPAQRPLLDAMIARTGADRTQLDRFKNWAVAASLDAGDAVAAGASSEDGVETTLWQAFRRPGKARSAFFRTGDQIATLDRLSADLQRQMLDNVLASKESYATVLKAWESGDLTTLDRAATCTPLDGKLVGQPNDRIAGWIARRMAQPGKVLVAVGLGHFAGPYALPKMLEARGLRVERVQ